MKYVYRLLNKSFQAVLALTVEQIITVGWVFTPSMVLCPAGWIRSRTRSKRVQALFVGYDSPPTGDKI